MLTRRSFLKASSLLAFAPTLPAFLAKTARAADPGRDARILVVVQLDGGNDALNSIVPYADPEYAKLRPTLKISAKDVVKINDLVGLHPSLAPLGGLLEKGRLAVLPGVTYPNPNRSHFESMAIWHTAKFDPEERKGYGWLGRALDAASGNSVLVGSGAVPGSLRGRRSATVSLARTEDLVLADPVLAKLAVGADKKGDLLDFVRRQAVEGNAAAEKMAGLARGSDATYPATALGERLRLAAGFLKADLGARVFYTLHGGYDTHAAQNFPHANLLREFSTAVQAFFNDLDQAKLSERVLLLAFSEFGRTIKENGSGGTDHGTTGCVFVAGPKVKAGLVGTMPSLTQLEGGEPKMTTDFRSVYATILDQWLICPSEQVLGGKFASVPIL
jgi:uncharacterized protein (DUF1501 family)